MLIKIQNLKCLFVKIIIRKFNTPSEYMHMFFFKCHYILLRNLLAVSFGHKPHFACVKEGYPEYHPASIGKNASYAGLPVFVENEWQRTKRLIGVL